MYSQLDKEQQLKAQLQQDRAELQPLEEKVTQVMQRVKLGNNGFVWLGLGGMQLSRTDTYDNTPIRVVLLILITCLKLYYEV